MNRIDEILAQHIKMERSADDAIATRLLVSLTAKPLPAQRHTLLRNWPTVLLNFDFAPAWPRIATLASAGFVGCMVGFFSPGAQIFEKPRTTSVQMADADPGYLVFEPEPLTGVRP
jgi:hypothetical protein